MKCPKCGRIFDAKLFRVKPRNTIMIKDILENDSYIKRFGMCKECYENNADD